MSQKSEHTNYAQLHIQDMKGYEPGEQPQFGKIIKLNTNENPYQPSEKVVNAIADAAKTNLNLYPDPSSLGFRKLAAELYDVDPDWIICGNGSDDILTILMRTFVSSGGTIRTFCPTYTLYQTLAKIQNAKIRQVLPESDFSVPKHFFETAGEKGDIDPELIFLANPNSPTGTIESPQRIIDHLRSLPCPLVIDEAYGEFAESNCVDLVKHSDKVIVTRTLSKSYSLAGLRFGYGIAQPHVIAEMQKVKDSYNCDRLSISGAIAALTDQSWLSETLGKIKTTRERLSKELAAMNFDVVPSHANFVWCRHRNQESKDLYESLKAKKILVRYMKYEGWGDGIRVTVGTDAQIDAFLSVLKGVLDS